MAICFSVPCCAILVIDRDQTPAARKESETPNIPKIGSQSVADTPMRDQNIPNIDRTHFGSQSNHSSMQLSHSNILMIKTASTDRAV